MAINKQTSYPKDKDIVEGIRKFGSIASYARSVGVDRRRMSEHISRNAELKSAVEKIRADKLSNPEQISDTEILTARNKELEKKLTGSRSEAIKDEARLRRLEKAITALEPKYDPYTIPKNRTFDEDDDQHEFALLFSDTHAAEVVSPDETLGINEYDWNIMLERMAKLQKSVISFQEHRPYQIKKLNIWMLGDMLSGDIHEELRTTNDRTLEEATVQFAYDSATWIQEFVPYFEDISIAAVPGNHPRRTVKPQAKNSFNNADWTTYQMMRMLTANNDTIEWNIPRSAFATTDVAKYWRVLLMHGDGIRTTMPGVPWGGVARRITTLQQQFAQAKQPIDYICMGHWHTANTLDGVGTKTFMNGSVKGVDEYSLKQFGSGRGPSQLLLTFHPRHGITDTSFIDLEEVQPAGA